MDTAAPSTKLLHGRYRSCIVHTSQGHQQKLSWSCDCHVTNWVSKWSLDEHQSTKPPMLLIPGQERGREGEGERERGRGGEGERESHIALHVYKCIIVQLYTYMYEKSLLLNFTSKTVSEYVSPWLIQPAPRYLHYGQSLIRVLHGRYTCTCKCLHGNE